MTIEFEVDGEVYSGSLLADEAPESAAALRSLLPLEGTLLHVRWSGYAVWVDLTGIGLPDLPRENHTVYPSRGDVLLYPGYRNDPELLVACGPTCFKSPAGELAGNHVATVDATRRQLRSLERALLETGAKPVVVRERS